MTQCCCHGVCSIDGSTDDEAQVLLPFGQRRGEAVEVQPAGFGGDGAFNCMGRLGRVIRCGRDERSQQTVKGVGVGCLWLQQAKIAETSQGVFNEQFIVVEGTLSLDEIESVVESLLD